nr:metaxin-like protein [Quercus suber]
MIQLHVLGPAFGLPSIEAECIAAIALLQTHVSGQYEIVPGCTTNPRLPLLITNDSGRISGFRNIARYLRNKSRKDDSSTINEHAASIATCSFLLSNAQLLLDIALYVSFENYRHATRPAFTRILPWYANYITPPSLRSAARARTDHLGVSSLDVDNVHEDMSNRPEGFDGVGKETRGFDPEAQKRASLLLPRKETLRSLLRKPEHAAVFKLHALAEGFFGPLQEMLGETEFLEGQEIADVDLLAYGFLSLMVYTKLPQDWLANTMKRKYKKLVAYTERLHRRLGMATKVEDVMALGHCKNTEDIADKRRISGMMLPWTAPATTSIASVVGMVTKALVEQIPIIGGSTISLVHSRPVKSFSYWAYLPVILATTTTVTALSTFYAFRTGWLIWPHGEATHIFGRKRFADYGHLGAALAGISMLGQQANQDAAYHAQEQSANPASVEVQVDEELVG